MPSSCPEYTFNLVQPYWIPSTVTVAWEPSPKNTPALGFLDLPKELRTMVYQEICDHLPPAGRSNPQYFDGKGYKVCPLQELSYPYTERIARCTIMRTCRQVHSEFAELLYSYPFEMHVGRHNNSLPLAATYSKLVRSVFVEAAGRYLNPSPTDMWQDALQIGNRLAKLFPNVKVLRMMWPISGFSYTANAYGEKVEPLWDLFDGRLDESRETAVKIVERTLRRYCRELGLPATVPHQFELIRIRDDGTRIDTPFAEAARNLRRKPPKKSLAVSSA